MPSQDDGSKKNENLRARTRHCASGSRRDPQRFDPPSPPLDAAGRPDGMWKRHGQPSRTQTRLEVVVSVHELVLLRCHCSFSKPEIAGRPRLVDPEAPHNAKRGWCSPPVPSRPGATRPGYRVAVCGLACKISL